MAKRTTMRSRSGTKLYAVRDAEGKFKDIQTYKRAHAADMRHKSAAEKKAAQGPIEKSVRSAASGAAKSMKGAVATVKRAAKRAVKSMTGSPARKKTTAKKTAKRAAGKKTAKRAARKTRS